VRLEDLDYFLAVAEAGHVGRASEKIGATQPALTKGVQRLERELKLQLFERTAKGMVLTDAGETFYERVRNVRSGLDDAVKEANDLHFGKIGLVRAGVSPVYVEHFFRDACAELLRQRPAARVQITMGLNDRLFASLRQGELDFCISALRNTNDPDFEREPLFTDNLHAVARKDHPIFLKPNLKFTDLGSASWILPGTKVMARRAVEASFAQHGLPPPNVVIESNSTVVSLMGMVTATDLLSVTGESTLRRVTGEGLRTIPLQDATWPRVIGITTRRGAYLSPLTLRMLELLRERAKPVAA